MHSETNEQLSIPKNVPTKQFLKLMQVRTHYADKRGYKSERLRSRPKLMQVLHIGFPVHRSGVRLTWVLLENVNYDGALKVPRVFKYKMRLKNKHCSRNQTTTVLAHLQL